MFIVTNNMRVHRKLILCIFNERFASFLIISCKMSLDLENKNQAYLCGRLFAVLEKIQQDASGGGLNRTIKDSYFASACSKPSTVFPKLYKLSQNHIKKLSSPIFYNKLCGEILDGLDGKFPSTLSLDDQGRFIVGYAQQNKALYTKKSEE